jgi:hypothetical protein
METCWGAGANGGLEWKNKARHRGLQAAEPPHPAPARPPLPHLPGLLAARPRRLGHRAGALDLGVGDERQPGGVGGHWRRGGGRGGFAMKGSQAVLGGTGGGGRGSGGGGGASGWVLLRGLPQCVRAAAAGATAAPPRGRRAARDGTRKGGPPGPCPRLRPPAHARRAGRGGPAPPRPPRRARCPPRAAQTRRRTAGGPAGPWAWGGAPGRRRGSPWPRADAAWAALRRAALAAPRAARARRCAAAARGAARGGAAPAAGPRGGDGAAAGDAARAGRDHALSFCRSRRAGRPRHWARGRETPEIWGFSGQRGVDWDAGTAGNAGSRPSSPRPDGAAPGARAGAQRCRPRPLRRWRPQPRSQRPASLAHPG